MIISVTNIRIARGNIELFAFTYHVCLCLGYRTSEFSNASMKQRCDSSVYYCRRTDDDATVSVFVCYFYTATYDGIRMCEL